MRPNQPWSAVLAIVLTLSAAAPSRGGQHAHGSGGGAAPIAPMKAHTGPLPALPGVAFEPSRPMAVIHRVYEFAARHPEVLQYVPCYCGCEREGHNGNHDCFVKSRTAAGRVTEWSTHGLGCTICIDVARDAMTLFDAGSTPRQIREAIDGKYRSRYPSATPTPLPARR